MRMRRHKIELASSLDSIRSYSEDLRMGNGAWTIICLRHIRQLAREAEQLILTNRLETIRYRKG